MKLKTFAAFLRISTKGNIPSRFWCYKWRKKFERLTKKWRLFFDYDRKVRSIKKWSVMTRNMNESHECWNSLNLSIAFTKQWRDTWMLKNCKFLIREDSVFDIWKEIFSFKLGAEIKAIDKKNWNFLNKLLVYIKQRRLEFRVLCKYLRMYLYVTYT